MSSCFLFTLTSSTGPKRALCLFCVYRDCSVSEACKCKPYRIEIQSLSVGMTGGLRCIRASPSKSRIGMGMMAGYMTSPPEAMVNGNRRSTGKESNRG